MSALYVRGFTISAFRSLPLNVKLLVWREQCHIYLVLKSLIWYSQANYVSLNYLSQQTEIKNKFQIEHGDNDNGGYDDDDNDDDNGDDNDDDNGDDNDDDNGDDKTNHFSSIHYVLINMMAQQKYANTQNNTRQAMYE